MQAYVIGGTANVLRLHEGFIDKVAHHALGSNYRDNPFKDIFHVPASSRLPMVRWLEANGFYAKTTIHGTKYRYLNRVKIAEFLGVDTNDIVKGKFCALLRQFESDLLNRNKKLLISSGLQTELPSHRTQTIETIAAEATTETRVDNFLSVWKLLLQLRQELPEGMPSCESHKLVGLRRRLRHVAKPAQHTPWVPLKTALAYTRGALELVMIGDELVDFYIRTIKHFYSADLFGGDNVRVRARRRRIRDLWINANVPDRLRAVGVSRWTSWFGSATSPDRFSRVRKEPSLNDSMQVLIGAIIVLIATLKPIRRSELLLLKRNCLTFVENDGYWLEQTLAKSRIGDLRTDTAKPVPAIVARAVSMLARLGDGLADYLHQDDPLAQNTLFYLPNFSKCASLKPRRIDGSTLGSLLDRFCDYVALPPDEHGRRWYLRVHELRKSFLITLFWCFRYASLDAARWIAGHQDAAHIYAYIEGNFPGEELPQLEAEYAASQLWDFELRGERGETVNIELLHDAVCNHFGVRSIELLSEQDVLDWLEIAFRENHYRICPYTLDCPGASNTAIAFRFEETKQR